MGSFCLPIGRELVFDKLIRQLAEEVNVPIIVSEGGLGERGRKDAKRHRDKQKDVIRKQLPDIISEEAIITGNRKGKKIRIPIRRLDIPHFRPGEKGRGIGTGQGSGEEGDTIGRRLGKGRPGRAGQDPGEDYVETEVDIEEVIEMMLEDLGLPRLQQKELREVLVELGFKITGRTKSGPWVLLDKKATSKEALKRFWHFLAYLEKTAEREKLVCFSALKQSKGVLSIALELLKNPDFKASYDKVQPFPIFATEDFVYRKIKEDFDYRSNAVLIAMMDVSASMTVIKKYLARSMLFWLVEFLRKIYSTVEIRFITHHSVAKLVDEDSFFHTVESGGTKCYTAYELANQLVETEYPVNLWNVYAFHFSDGEDWEIERTIEEIAKLMNKGINMLGYGEICPESGYSDSPIIFDTLRGAFLLDEIEYDENGPKMIVGKGDMPLIGVKIEVKEHLLPALKAFLRKDRWTDE